LARALATSQYHLEQQRRRKAEDQLEGQGIGLTALAMLLGHPEDGLIEAVKRLVAERDKYRQLHDMEAESRKATRDGMTVEYDQLRAEADRLRGLLREAHKELSTIEAITVSPSDTDGLIDLCRRMRAAIGGTD
jgi:hypothetical protein